MGFWNKLFGRGQVVGREADAAETITVYDEFGKELRVTKRDWSHSVLKPNLKKAWNDSDKLSQLYISRHGPSGVVLTNLAKVYVERGDRPRAMELLWQALELDPNQDNALLWYEAEAREVGGESASLDAFRKVAAFAGKLARSGLVGSRCAQSW